MPIKSADELRDVVQRIIVAAGTPQDSADVVANHLVGSHLAGHDSHGIQHLPRYIRNLRAGRLVPDARPEVASETSSTALVYGNWGWGHVTADFATSVGIEKAQRHGIALVSAVKMHHIGRLGHYVEQAAEQGIAALLVSGGQGEERPTAAPYGGSKGVLAPNPIAIGFPVLDGPPVVVDFAATQVAGGKVALAKAKGVDLPSGWLIDKDGSPSVNPNDWYDGGVLLPFGKHKGFGIMVAIEILGRILSGADAYSDSSHGGVYFHHCGVTLIAIDSGVFSPVSQFAARTAELAERIRAVPPAPGFDEVIAPGDFEHRARESRLDWGIQIPESTWREIIETGESLGLDL